jgi:magnesium transporter
MNKGKEINKSVYPPETAGRLMVKNVPVIGQKATIGQVEALLIKETAKFETINYIYVLSKRRKLKGVISLKEVFRENKNTPVERLLTQEIVSVRSYTDQERIAFLALRHNLKAVPVVDKDNHFLGVVTSDDILHILDNEAVEDILRFGGIIPKGPFDNILSIPLFKSLLHRLPWLILGLFGGLLAAGIVNRFEETLSRNLILAAFIPLIVYMADAIGTQMEAFIIRDLAVNPKIAFLKYFSRQIGIVSILGVVISLTLFLISFILFSNPKISLVLTLALFFAVLSSVFTGLVIPYFFGKLKLDPANASGPIATIIQDVLSVLVYFLIAFWLL